MVRAARLQRQCRAILADGRRCSITEVTNVRDKKTGLHAGEPLKKGASFCSFHAKFFVGMPAAVTDAAELFFLDFETTGLSVVHDHIVEAALLGLRGAAFTTTVHPPQEYEDVLVHGISYEETLQSPGFKEVYQRLAQFVHSVLDMAIEEDPESSGEDVSMLTTLAEARPKAILVAHNGLQFDFPMLLSHCIRHDVDPGFLKSCAFVDTLAVLRALNEEIYGGCPKLQCVRSKLASGASLRAHRALDDCFALREITAHVAASFGMRVDAFLKMFAIDLDYEASMRQLGAML